MSNHKITHEQAMRIVNEAMRDTTGDDLDRDAVEWAEREAVGVPDGDQTELVTSLAVSFMAGRNYERLMSGTRAPEDYACATIPAEEPALNGTAEFYARLPKM